MPNEIEPYIPDAPSGTTFTLDQLQRQTHVRYGGIAWPGRRPGFGVVLALGKEKHFGSSNVYLLDEVESSDMRELIHRCAGLDAKHVPTWWVGDNRNSAASRFIHELNAAQQPPPNDYEDTPNRKGFYVCPSQLLDIERPYEYMLPTLKALLDKDRRQLFLKDSRIIPYLGEIKPDEIPYLEWGEYPAIEALTFAAWEITRWRPPEPNHRYSHRRSKVRM